LIFFALLQLPLAQPGLGSSNISNQHANKDATQWETKLRNCRQELAKSVPDEKRLIVFLASVAAATHDKKTVDEALSLFEAAETQKKVLSEAAPYYAQLLLEKYELETRSLEDQHFKSEQALQAGEFRVFSGTEFTVLAERLLSPALQIFLKAYGDEAGKDAVDARKLFDIGARIASLYERLGRKEEAEQWLHSMLGSPLLSDGGRATIAYRFAVQSWKKSYDLTIKYVVKNQPVPEADYPLIRQLVSEAYSYIQTAHELDPKYANAWFYEKLIALEEYRIEPDPEKKKAIQARAIRLQDRYLALMKEQKEAESHAVENTSAYNYDKPYASGLPSLNFSGFAIFALPPPPPPPPAPPLAPDAKPPDR
jgi:hypothetical protein